MFRNSPRQQGFRAGHWLLFVLFVWGVSTAPLVWRLPLDGICPSPPAEIELCCPHSAAAIPDSPPAGLPIEEPCEGPSQPCCCEGPLSPVALIWQMADPLSHLANRALPVPFLMANPSHGQAPPSPPPQAMFRI